MKKLEYSYKNHDFNILKNQQGVLMLIVRSFEGNIEKPQLICNENQNATLYHNKGNLIKLSLHGIPPSMRQCLIQSKTILVYETDKGNIIREYTAEIKQPKGKSSLNKSSKTHKK